LSLSHGNAAPEKGFSVNNSVLSKERLALGEQTICAERLVKEAVRLFGSVTNNPITKELIAASRRAYAEYTLQLEKEKIEKRAKDEEQRRLLLINEERISVSNKM
jgi:ribosomal protein L9